jgi:DNA-binding transcriptional LysR family regulator
MNTLRSIESLLLTRYNLKQIIIVMDTIMSGINRLDLKQLRIFMLLIEERNVSRVAQKMGLTQQAVSEQLRKLRDTFNDELFVRSSNGVIPTKFTQRIEPKIHTIINNIEGLFTEDKFDPATINGTVNICTTDYALMTVLPDFLSKLREQAPSLKVVIRDFESRALLRLMSAGEIDLLLTFPEFVPKTLKTQFLFEEHHICVAGRGSQYLDKEYSVSDIAKLPQIVISPSRTNLHGALDEWFTEKGLKRNIVMSVTSFSATPKIIKATDSIGFVPSRLLPHPDIEPIKLQEKLPSFKVIAAWHKRLDKSQLHNWLLRLLN